MLLNNILYIHIPRTGGTTFEKILGFKGHDERPACGNAKWGSDHKTIMGWDKNLKIMLQHAKYNELIEHHFIPEENNLITVSIIRNPYYRTVSLYNYFGGPKKWGNFDQFVKFLEDMQQSAYFYRPMIDYLSLNNKLQINHLIRFESYQKDVEEFSSLYDLNLNVKFDQERHNKKIPIIEDGFYANQKIKDRVYSIYRQDFDEFGYDR